MSPGCALTCGPRLFMRESQHRPRPVASTILTWADEPARPERRRDLATHSTHAKLGFLTTKPNRLKSLTTTAVLYFSDNLRLQDGGCCPFEAADLCCCSPGALVRSVRAGYSLRAHPGFWLRDQCTDSSERAAAPVSVDSDLYADFC
jgi:hypothetical protein